MLEQIDIEQEREYIKNVDEKMRALELEKAKLEQNKIIVEDQKRQVIEKMESLGCTPENIEEKINEYSSKVLELKTKMETILDPKKSE